MHNKRGRGIVIAAKKKIPNDYQKSVNDFPFLTNNIFFATKCPGKSVTLLELLEEFLQKIVSLKMSLESAKLSHDSSAFFARYFVRSICLVLGRKKNFFKSTQ